MAFQNEYVPKPEAQTSEFLRTARTELRLGFVANDKWTVDRERELVLVRTGRGSDIDSQNEEYFSFLWGRRKYRFHTTVLETRPLTPRHLHIIRSIRFVVSPDLARPTPEVIHLVKEALTVHKDFGVISQYESCDLVLKNWMGDAL